MGGQFTFKLRDWKSDGGVDELGVATHPTAQEVILGCNDCLLDALDKGCRDTVERHGFTNRQRGSFRP